MGGLLCRSSHRGQYRGHSSRAVRLPFCHSRSRPYRTASLRGEHQTTPACVAPRFARRVGRGDASASLRACFPEAGERAHDDGQSSPSLPGCSQSGTFFNAGAARPACSCSSCLIRAWVPSPLPPGLGSARSWSPCRNALIQPGFPRCARSARRWSPCGSALIQPGFPRHARSVRSWSQNRFEGLP
jgi:hypothetical protein